MAKNRIRILVDIAMTVLLPMLMAYSLIGEKFHEIIGTLMFALFILIGCLIVTELTKLDRMRIKRIGGEAK